MEMYIPDGNGGRKLVNFDGTSAEPAEPEIKLKAQPRAAPAALLAGAQATTAIDEVYYPDQDGGRVLIDTGGGLASLPTASTSVKGGVMIGAGLSMAGDTLNVTIQSGTCTLPTASTTQKGGVKVGTGLQMDGEVLNVSLSSADLPPISSSALPIASTTDTGVVKVGSGLSVSEDGTLAVTLPSGSSDTGSSSGGGGCCCCGGNVYFAGTFPALPTKAPFGWIVFVSNKGYIYNGNTWLPFCNCNCTPEPEPEPDPPPTVDTEPQISTRTIPCTITIPYGYLAEGENDNYIPWTWKYDGDGYTALLVPDSNITATGVNGEAIELVTNYDSWVEDTNVWLYENSGNNSMELLLPEDLGADSSLAPKLNWNHWIDSSGGHAYSMTINLTFDLPIKTVVAGYEADSYSVSYDERGDYYFYTKTEEDAEAAGVVVRVNGSTDPSLYQQDEYEYRFDTKPNSLVIEYYDFGDAKFLQQFNIDWAQVSGANALHITAGGSVEIPRTQHLSDAQNHTSSMVANLPCTSGTVSPDCGNVWQAHTTVYNYPKIEDEKLVLGVNSYVQLEGGLTLGGQDFTIDGTFIGCQYRQDLQRVFYLRTAADAQSDTYPIALMLNQGQMGLHVSFMGQTLAINAVRAQWHHFAIVYQHTQGKVTLYIDGLQAATANVTLPQTAFSEFVIGNSPTELTATSDVISRFARLRVFNGVAVWTDNFYIDENIIDNTTPVEPQTAGYLSFTGQAGSYAELPLAVLAGATTFTIEVKFSTASTKSTRDAWTWGTIAGREIPYFGKDDFGLCVNGGKLCFWCSPASKGTSSSNIQTVTSSATVNDGEIHEVAVVSSNGAIDLYCDGVNVAHTDNVNAKITDAQTILLAYDSDSNSYLQMDLYEARFWNVARSAEEIFADITGTETGLQGWYLPTADGLKDYSGNGRHATLYGSPAYTPPT